MLKGFYLSRRGATLGGETEKTVGVCFSRWLAQPFARAGGVVSLLAIQQLELKDNMTLQAIDLTQRPPRSPRVRLGGYAILPRLLDKGRAVLAGKQGEYKFACPLDMQFLDFVGVDPKALKKELAKGLQSVGSTM